MKTPNCIPKGRTDVAALAAQAVAATARLGDIVGLRHSTAPVVAANYQNLVGLPGPAPATGSVGRQGELSAAVAQAAAARAELQATVRSARQFGVAALLLLRNTFGSRLNSQWRAAGFTLKSLIIPYDPAGVLLELRSYYRLHPERESAEQNLSAARADALLSELQQRRHAVAETRAAEVTARRSRNTALQALRRRLSHLRAELAQLLTADDPRWYEFGFQRPIDGHLPEPVSDLTVEPGLRGEAAATWPPARLATSYRVTWRPDVPDSAETEVGIVKDRGITIGDLPVGIPVIIAIAARNRSGESAPKEMSILLSADGSGKTSESRGMSDPPRMAEAEPSIPG